MSPRLCRSGFMDLQWDMNTWNSHLTSSCWCGVSQWDPLCEGVGTSLTAHLSEKNSDSLSVSCPCSYAWIYNYVCVLCYLFVCIVNIALWVISLLRQRNDCENSWEIRRQFFLPVKRRDLHTAQSPDSTPVPRRNMHMHVSCMHTHTHTKDSSTSTDCIMHFRSFHHLLVIFHPVFHLKQTTTIRSLIFFRKRMRVSCSTSLMMI